MESEEQETMEEEGDAPKKAGPSRRREAPKEELKRVEVMNLETFGIGLPGPSRKGRRHPFARY